MTDQQQANDVEAALRGESRCEACGNFAAYVKEHISVGTRSTSAKICRDCETNWYDNMISRRHFPWTFGDWLDSRRRESPRWP